MDKIYDVLVSFAKVLAAMSPWLVVGFFVAGVIAVMMEYNLIRPVKMAPAKHAQ